MTIEQIIRGIAEKWLLEAEARCPHCKMKWDLGRHGCHYEPLPEGESPEGFDGISLNCMAFGIRRRMLELLAALPDILAAQKAETAALFDLVQSEIGLYAAKYMQSRSPRVEIANEILQRLIKNIPANAAEALAEEIRKARLEAAMYVYNAAVGPYVDWQKIIAYIADLRAGKEPQ